MVPENPTPDEIMVFCIARQLQDGEVVAQGIATPLVAAAYLLAHLTHAPNLYFASAIGQSICRQPARMGITHIERLWLDLTLTNTTFVRVVTEILPSLRPKEFFRPGQMDPNGNTNNIAFGKNYQRPRMRMPGTGGIPDVTPFLGLIYLYVPRHSRVTFVPTLDICSGIGHNPARRMGQGPAYLITNLGQFDFANGQMRLTTVHPGVTPEQIQAHTGFPLEVAPDLHETPLPSPAELRLLREQVDPLSIRRLETLSGSERRQHLRQILTQERHIVADGLQ